MTHLKCVIVISKNVYVAYKFLCDFIQQITRSAFSQNSWKNCDNSASQQGMLAKIISSSFCKVSILHSKFCTISCNRIRGRTITRILGKMEQQRSLPKYMYPNCITVISNDIYFVHKYLCNFIHQKLRSAYPKNFRKSETTPVERLCFPYLISILKRGSAAS